VDLSKRLVVNTPLRRSGKGKMDGNKGRFRWMWINGIKLEITGQLREDKKERLKKD